MVISTILLSIQQEQIRGPSKIRNLFISDDDSLYVVDTGNSRIVHMDKDGRLLNLIGDTEGSGKLQEPKGVFVKEDGTVYVADTKTRVLLFLIKMASS